MKISEYKLEKDYEERLIELSVLKDIVEQEFDLRTKEVDYGNPDNVADYYGLYVKSLDIGYEGTKSVLNIIKDAYDHVVEAELYQIEDKKKTERLLNVKNQLQLAFDEYFSCCEEIKNKKEIFKKDFESFCKYNKDIGTVYLITLTFLECSTACDDQFDALSKYRKNVLKPLLKEADDAIKSILDEVWLYVNQPSK